MPRVAPPAPPNTSKSCRTDQYSQVLETDAVDTTGVVDAPDEVEADEANDTENMDGPQR